jgi:hypothetical protein
VKKENILALSYQNQFSHILKVGFAITIVRSLYLLGHKENRCFA